MIKLFFIIFIILLFQKSKIDISIFIWLWKQYNHNKYTIRLCKEYTYLPCFKTYTPKHNIVICQNQYSACNSTYAGKFGYDYVIDDYPKYLLINNLLQTYEYVIYLSHIIEIRNHSNDLRHVILSGGDSNMILLRSQDKTNINPDIMIFRKSNWSKAKIRQLVDDTSLATVLDEIDTDHNDSSILIRYGNDLNMGLPVLLHNICIFNENTFNIFHSDIIQIYPWATISGFQTISYNPVRIVLNHPNRIPPYVFQTMETELLPNQLAKPIEKWKQMNPEYQYIYFNSWRCREFIKTQFPERVYKAYCQLITGAYKADFWRYCVLYKYGGVYTDIRTVPLYPLSTFMQQHDKFVTCRDIGGPFLWQGFIASVPNHPILRYAIEEMCDMIDRREYGTNPLDITGPSRLGKAFNRYLRKNPSSWIPIGEYKYRNIRLLYHQSNGFVTHNNKKVIQTRCKISESQFLKLTGKEKYTTSWFKKRVYTCNHE